MSYVHQELLMKFLADQPRQRHYSGRLIHNCGQLYASGCGFVLSRDLVQYLVDNQRSFNYSVSDDHAVGAALEHIGVVPRAGDCQDFTGKEATGIQPATTTASAA